MANKRQKKKVNKAKSQLNQEVIKFSQNRVKQFRAVSNSFGAEFGKDNSNISRELKYLGNILGKSYDKIYMTRVRLENQLLREENQRLKKELEAKIKGLQDAKKEFKKNWTDKQQRVAQAVAAMQRYHGEQFHESYYTSGELLDIYDKIYDKNEDIPEALTDEEIELANIELSKDNQYLRRSEVKEDFEEKNSMLNTIIQRAKEMGIFTLRS